MNKKKLIIIVAAILVAAAAWFVWDRTASATRVALVNFQQFQTASIVKGNHDRFVRYTEVAPEDFDGLSRYDMVLGFGMGMRITADQRAQIQRAADKGIPVLIYASTNPENRICNLDSLQRKYVEDYLGSGNRKNYQSLARYIRKEIDGKRFFIETPDEPEESVSDVLYHLDDEVWFEDVADYESYLREKGFWNEGGARIAVVGGLNDPFGGNRANVDSLIVSFQRAGMNIYPVSSMMRRLDFLKAIQPDALIYFAHGRLAIGQADAAVEWLRECNIPIFAPLSILQTREHWEQDPMGMFGGFMSQSLVVPELDGAIYPYVINAQELDSDGLLLFSAIPERLRNFTGIVDNFVSLRRKANAEKKLAIYYFKGPGQQTLTAQGLETVPSLYNLLKRLRAEGYCVDGLPATLDQFEKLLMAQGAVFNAYAEGAFDEYLRKGMPALVSKTEYESWVADRLPAELYGDVTDMYGDAPGSYMSVRRDDGEYLAVARIEFGNVALLPQPMPGLGDDSFAIVHGAKSAPPHTYIGAYLWAEYAFGADAMLHFGTHGSLEFTPQKQVALSDYDWPDRLVGNIPHFYYYTIGNIGESIIAKRRSYATLVSYLTPPFMESGVRTQYKALTDKIREYWRAPEEDRALASLVVKKAAVEMGLHRELRLDSLLVNPYTQEEIERIENFAEELSNEKMTGQMYTTGVPYEVARINSSVMAMSADPIAYSVAALDKHRGKATAKQLENKPYFTRTYLEPARETVELVLSGRSVSLKDVAGISEEELARAREITSARSRRPAAAIQAAPAASKEEEEKPSEGDRSSHMAQAGRKPADMENPETAKDSSQAATRSSMPGNTGGDGMQAAGQRSESAGDMASGERKVPEITPEEKQWARAVIEAERTLNNILDYKKALEQSPETELQSLLNALAGGYVAPSSGGDAIANPMAAPTGRNLYAINAEATPSEAAWEKGVALVKSTIEDYQKKHGRYPRKVSYTFWSSEFIETEGATIAQVLYMLGVEPVRDAFGRVSDLRLIPSEELGRPRIDIVVQTSGQFRDLAASRLALISRAVEMAAAATGDEHDNYVAGSTVEIERQLVDNGVSPRDAREMSTARVFGGVNGMYGTAIQGMVMSGDRWEDDSEIANTYINNMSAVYGGEKEWGEFREGLLRAVLHSTDMVVQPRQSNVWGALSLDHVFEFMGGMNLAVREVTGKDPDAYFADYRNRNNVRMQELKEAIGVESRTTIFNPNYIREVMKGRASSAAQITEVVTNTYGWNVMKPDVIDKEMWDEIYDVYVEDRFGFGVQEFYRRENPAAMQEITAVMLETARKGMWEASEQQLATIADIHTKLVRDFGASGSGMSSGNAKLQDFIARKAPANAAEYRNRMEQMQNASDAAQSGKGMVLKKENRSEEERLMSLNGALITGLVLAVFVALLIAMRRKRK